MQKKSEEMSPDEVGIQAIDGLYRERLYLIIDNGTADLAKATENSFNDHLIALTDIWPAETDDFQRTTLVLKQESICRLSLAIRGQLYVHDLAHDDNILMVILLRICQKLGDLEQAGGRCGQCHAEKCRKARDDQDEKSLDQGARG